MRTVKLVIAFDGTRYQGWQSQKKGRSIQEVLELNLFKICKEKVYLVSSSRTDAGVHARGLTAHFRTHSRLPDIKMKRALNFHIPKDILIVSTKTAANNFHARYQAKSKVYIYDIWNSPTRPLFEAPYVLWHPDRLDSKRMKKAASFLKGRHDFRAFCDKGDAKDSYVRNIKSIRIKKMGPILRLKVEADGFLRHMIRVIAGTLIEVGRYKKDPYELINILKSKDRKKAGPTARSQALTLTRVKY